MLELLTVLNVIEFVGFMIILIDFGPEAVKKVKAWGRKEHWFR